MLKWIGLRKELPATILIIKHTFQSPRHEGFFVI